MGKDLTAYWRQKYEKEHELRLDIEKLCEKAMKLSREFVEFNKSFFSGVEKSKRQEKGFLSDKAN